MLIWGSADMYIFPTEDIRKWGLDHSHLMFPLWMFLLKRLEKQKYLFKHNIVFKFCLFFNVAVGLQDIDLSSPLNYGTPSSMGSVRTPRSGIRGTPIRMRPDIRTDKRIRQVNVGGEAVSNLNKISFKFHKCIIKSSL